MTRSPATSVTRAFAFSLAPVGYWLAEGPVERTTKDCAAAVPASATAMIPAAPVRPRRPGGASGQEIPFPLFGPVTALDRKSAGVGEGGSGGEEAECGRNHTKNTK